MQGRAALVVIILAGCATDGIDFRTNPRKPKTQLHLQWQKRCIDDATSQLTCVGGHGARAALEVATTAQC